MKHTIIEIKAHSSNSAKIREILKAKNASLCDPTGILRYLQKFASDGIDRETAKILFEHARTFGNIVTGFKFGRIELFE